MMVAVEESCARLANVFVPSHPDISERLTQRLLLQEQEAGVEELQILGQVVELIVG
jgi:hypothetical protein